MSQANVERVRAGIEAYNRGDIEALIGTYDPDVVFETLLLGTHVGREAVRLLYDENRRNLSGYRLDPEEVIDAGDKVISVVRLGGAGPASQIATGDQIAFLATFEDDLVVRQQTFRNKEEALAAAELGE
ncbi:hypothetical protein BH20ACT15_BH20ACT15_10170 [soil metagenome]